MDLEDKITIAQAYLKEHRIDGWLIYSFHNLNSICSDLLSLPSHLHQSRKFLYFIPQRGDPVKIVHLIEKHLYESIKGKELVYKSLEQWNQFLKELLSPLRLIACDYSPMGEIPTLSKIDAGTFEKIISLGVEVQSSGEIISQIFGVLSKDQIALHRKAAQKLAHIYERIPEFVRSKPLYEKDLQDYIVESLKEANLEGEDLPICAVGVNTSYPHYQIIGRGKRLEKGSLLLVDMWAKEKDSEAVFADMTQMFYLGEEIDPKAQNLFSLTLEGQQIAIDYFNRTLEEGKTPIGSVADHLVRSFFEKNGMEEAIFHRLGHSIEQKLHGRGPNLDSLETKDQRPLKQGMLFSIEPGLYLMGKMGIRLEIDALIGKGLEITTARQLALPLIRMS